MSDRLRRQLFYPGFVVLVAGIALLPWWRNHGYVRSFFDYGVVVGGAGRIAEGQRPYVDFVTPTQTGWYLFNRWAEKAGDGTFQAMTLGGAFCTVVSLVILLGMLSRRWSLPVAAAVTGALLCATVTQHTLFWYNPWGVVLLAMVAWAGAIAPVLRREHWAWHALAAAGLFLGGINKINMQLMALGLACAWAVRAGLTGRSGWGRVGVTLLFYAACLVPPVLAEMAWTGASLATWWHNVIALPAAARTGMLRTAFTTDFLRLTPQDYYGPMLLPKIVPYGLGATVLVVTAIMRKTWREAGWMEKILPLACGAVAALGGAVLLTTNMDIAYIGLAGWLALLVALWLGYEMPARGPWFYGALVLPVVGLGVLSWRSAWEGQRSQFGHSFAARADYVDGAQAGADFGYFRGTRLPPEVVESLRRMGEWRRSLTPEQRSHHYYGPGTEWAAHIWPAMHLPGLPLYMQLGSSFGSPEMARLGAEIKSGNLQEITVSPVVNYWPEREQFLLDHRYEKEPLGTEFLAHRRLVGSGVSAAPVWFTRAFGGNADSRYLASNGEFFDLGDRHKFLGLTEGTGTLLFALPTNRLEGDVVLQRLAGAPRIPLSAHFTIHAQANPTARFERWSRQVELPADQDEVLVPYAIDSSHFPTAFAVEIPPALKGLVAAGWRGPWIRHTGGDGPEEPAWFFRDDAPVTRLDEAGLAALLPAGWRPVAAFMRHGQVTADGIELAPGGEIWLRVKGLVTEFSGTAVMPLNGISPTVRGIWYSGGRLETFTDTPVRADDRTADIRAWCGEPGGWLVLATDPGQRVAPVTMRIHKVTHRDYP